MVSFPRLLRLALGLWCLILVLPPHTSWGADDVVQRFSAYYKELQEDTDNGPFGLPLQVRSEEREDRISAEIFGIFDYPFQAFAGLLTQPASWCEFVSLTPNIKACTFQGNGKDVILTLYVGWKGYRAPESASAQPYQFVVHSRRSDYAAMSVSAAEGLLGTRAHRFDVEAANVAGKTVFAMRSSYEPSALSKLVTTVYLATLGREKIGFSRVPDGAQVGHVRGIQGMIERNVVRYYLALKAFVDTQGLPTGRQFEARINTAYDLMDTYPAQLRLMEKTEYLDVKRRERMNQVRLQQRIGSVASPVPRS
jgi:hypothetical protein